jgi:hypothetical protein
LRRLHEGGAFVRLVVMMVVRHGRKVSLLRSWNKGGGRRPSAGWGPGG